MKLEVVVLNVSDVDRSIDFYSQAGFEIDVDHNAESFRVVQLTPPGSACSIIIGNGLGAYPDGVVRGLHLVVSDIEAAVAELKDQGVETTPVWHMGAEGPADGPDPNRSNYNSFSGFSDPDGNEWVLQEVSRGVTRPERQ